MTSERNPNPFDAIQRGDDWRTAVDSLGTVSRTARCRYLERHRPSRRGVAIRRDPHLYAEQSLKFGVEASTTEFGSRVRRQHEDGFIQGHSDPNVAGDAVISECLEGAFSPDVSRVEGIRCVNGMCSHRLNLPAECVSPAGAISRPLTTYLGWADGTLIPVSCTKDLYGH